MARLQGCCSPDLIPAIERTRQSVAAVESRVWAECEFGKEEARRWVLAARRRPETLSALLYRRDIKAAGYRLPVIIGIAKSRRGA